MNLTTPAMKDVARAAELPVDSFTALLKTVADSTGFPPGADSPDSWLGLAMSALAGVAAALAVAIVLTVYLRSGYRSVRDLVRDGVAAVAVLALIAFVVSDMRNAALAYLGINPSKPAVEFEIRLPKAAVSTTADTQIELHTDRNQTLATVQVEFASDDAGRAILRGSAPLRYRTTERVVVMNLPGQAQYQFRLRLPASPSRSDEFSPWHLVDHVDAPGMAAIPASTGSHDAYAIRYRVR